MKLEKDNHEEITNTEHIDVDTLIEQKQHLENLLKEKFTKRITVMFTDLKGSTVIAESEGDLESRALIKQHNDILLPIIKKNHGILVKTMGDGTLSYFEDAQDAVRAGTQIQYSINEHNVEKKPKVPILVRIGMHTGDCVVEKNDIFGDTVNAASRFESSANPGEVYLSEETYRSLTDKSEIYCRFIKTTTLKGKKGEFKIYKAFWNEKEIEADKYEPKQQVTKIKKRFPLFVKVLIGVIIPVIVALILIKGGVIPNPFPSSSLSQGNKRSLEHSVDIPVHEVKK